MKKIFKSRLFIFLVTAMTFLSVGVLADELLNAKDVLYAPNSSEFNVDNVKSALDQLYNMATETPHDFTYTATATATEISANINANDNFIEYYCAINDTTFFKASNGSCVFGTLMPNVENEIKIIGFDKEGNVKKKSETLSTLYAKLIKVSNWSNNCVKPGNTCTIDQIKSGVTINVDVSNGDTPDVRSFHVLSNSSSKLVLMMDTVLAQSAWNANTYYTSNSGGPLTALNKINTLTDNWNDLLTMKYNINDSNAEYTYKSDPIVAKARLPKKNDLTPVCPSKGSSYLCVSWVTKNGNAFTSSTNSNYPLLISSGGSLTTNGSADAIKNIVPVIEINKQYIDFES